MAELFGAEQRLCRLFVALLKTGFPEAYSLEIANVAPNTERHLASLPWLALGSSRTQPLVVVHVQKNQVPR